MLPLERESTAKLELALRSPLIGPAGQERIRAELARRAGETPAPDTPAPADSAPAAGRIVEQGGACELVCNALTAPASPPNSTPPRRRGVMNKTETRCAREILAPLVARGEIARYEFEPATWHIHGGTRYTPDFVAWCPDGTLWCVEVKGGLIRPQDRDRFKAHALARPWMRWTMMQWMGAARGGWHVVDDRRPVAAAHSGAAAEG